MYEKYSRFTQKELKEGKSHVTELTDKWFKDIRGSPLMLSESEDDEEQQVFTPHQNQSLWLSSLFKHNVSFCQSVPNVFLKGKVWD